MPRYLHTLALATAVAVLFAAFSISACGPRPAAAPARAMMATASGQGSKALGLSLEIFQQFAADLQAGRVARLELPGPNREGNATYLFKAVERPVSPERLVGAVFAKGTAVDGSSRTVRAALLSNTDLRLSILDDDAIYIARLSPGNAFQYQRLRSTASCAVREGDDQVASLRPAPALGFSASVISEPPAATLKRLRLVVAIGAKLSALYQTLSDPGKALEEDVAAMVNTANGVFNPDLGVDVTIVGSPLFPANIKIAGDPLVEIQKFIGAAVTVKKWTMDLGHLIEIGDGGSARIGSACEPGRSARGYSLTLDGVQAAAMTLIHEIGHQLGAPHSFNATSPFRSKRGAYEPGMGVSIMSYGDDRQSYFHASSMRFVSDHSWSVLRDRVDCGLDGPVLSDIPDVRVPDAVPHVPPHTPFELAAAERPSVTFYRWDEYDHAAKPDERPPVFASSPERGASRIYPPLAQLVAEPMDPKMPWPVTKATFRLLGFSAEGVIRSTDVDVTVEDKDPPFAITEITCPFVLCTTGKTIRVSWTSGKTLTAPYRVTTLRAQIVDSDTLKRYAVPGSFANSGSVTITLPAAVPSLGHARVMLHAVDGIFFALSQRFAIQ